MIGAHGIRSHPCLIIAPLPPGAQIYKAAVLRNAQIVLVVFVAFGLFPNARATKRILLYVRRNASSGDGAAERETHIDGIACGHVR